MRTSSRAEKRLGATSPHHTDVRLHQSVLDAVVDGIVAIDRDGYVLLANPAAARMLDRPIEEIVGEPFPYPHRPGASAQIAAERLGRRPAVLEIRTSELEVRGAPVYVADIRDVTDIVDLRAELESQSRTDDLTGLLNRRGFLGLCEQYLHLADRSERGLLIICADLDALKHINDTYGHAAGDEALARAAAAMRVAVRDTDLVGRIGGDEFAAALLQTSARDAEAVRNRVDAALRGMALASTASYTVTVSIGASHYPPRSGRTVAELLAEADAVMYAAKRAQSTTNDRASGPSSGEPR